MRTRRVSLELNWMYDDVLRNADRLTTYRQICAQVAREFGIFACFMTKPFMGVSAIWLSPQHVAVAWREGSSSPLAGPGQLAGHG